MKEKYKIGFDPLQIIGSKLIFFTNQYSIINLFTLFFNGVMNGIGVGDDNTPNRAMAEQINTGISLVGKGSVVPEGYVLGRNVVVHANTGEGVYGKRKKVASGHDVGAARR